MANTETTVNELVINQLSKTKYESLKAAGTLQENQLYMVNEVEEAGGGANIDDTQLSTTSTYSSSKIDSTYAKAGDTYSKEELYTKNEIDTKLSSAYRYVGSVASYSDLPSTNLSQGNVYNVEDTGMNYAWTGTKWDALGSIIDISGKQDKLVSGTNIKTINGESLLGKGNISITGGLSSTLNSNLTIAKSLPAIYLKDTSSDVGGTMRIEWSRDDTGTTLEMKRNYKGYDSITNSFFKWKAGDASPSSILNASYTLSGHLLPWTEDRHRFL